MEIDLLRDDAIRNNKVIKSFLEVPENQKLYKELMESKHNKDVLKELNKQFVNFFLEIRLLKYISTIINNSIIELDLQSRKKEQALVPYDEGLHEKHCSPTTVDISTVFDEETTIECLKSLTEKEKSIIYLIFYKGLREAEIAQHLNISQQAVSKRKRRALQKIRDSIGRGNGDEITSSGNSCTRER